MAKKLVNNLFDKQFGAKTGLDQIKELSDNLSVGSIDYLQLQANQPSLILKDIYNEDDGINSIAFNRQELFTDALWSDDSSELYNVYTSSNQSINTAHYYREIYKYQDTASLTPEFNIAYADYYGLGALTASINNMFYSKTVYTQYKNMLLSAKEDKFTFEYPHWQNLITTGSRIYSVGINISGSLGFGNTSSYSNYESNMQINEYVKVCAGYYYSTALHKDGTIWSWGMNNNGQLGDGTTVSKFYPIQVGTDSDWKLLTSGPYNSFAIKNDGTLWGWGRNQYGQLGDGTTTNILSPTQIDGGSWDNVSAGSGHSTGVKTDGTLWTWGKNNYGQLGDGTNTDNYTPTQINIDTDWSASYAGVHPDGNSTTFGTKVGGGLYGWGRNNVYQLGTGTNTDENTPQLISNDYWKMIAPGSNHTFGITPDNKLYAWGDNTQYKLGMLTSVNPIETPTHNTSSGDIWDFINTSIESTIAISTDGKFYVWGKNNEDQIGVDRNFQLLPGRPPFTMEYEEDKKNESVVIKSVAVSNNYNGTSINDGHSLVLKQYNFNENAFTEPDFVYVLNVDRKRFKDGIKPGSWQLSLSAVDFDNKPINHIPPITLIDDSQLTNIDFSYKKDIFNYTTNWFIPKEYLRTIPENNSYNLYSGSLIDGFYTGSFAVPFGKFYPDNGIIVLNGMSLHSFQSIFLYRSSDDYNTMDTASNPFPSSSNADIIYTAISGALSINSSSYSIRGTSFERVESSFVFVRIHSNEFNYSNNPSYLTGENYFIKPSLKNYGNGITYITTIGLYNENQELLAVAKLSRPIKKTENIELVIKIRIRY